MTAQPNRKKLGYDGENFVVNYLTKHGFKIITQNYRKFFGEIDIIASKKNLYIFVEVKTRKSNLVAMGQLISPLKQAKIIKTAEHFIAENKLMSLTFRFDVALVCADNQNFSLEYIENAFTKAERSYHNY